MGLAKYPHIKLLLLYYTNLFVVRASTVGDTKIELVHSAFATPFIRFVQFDHYILHTLYTLQKQLSRWSILKKWILLVGYLDMLGALIERLRLFIGVLFDRKVSKEEKRIWRIKKRIRKIRKNIWRKRKKSWEIRRRLRKKIENEYKYNRASLCLFLLHFFCRILVQIRRLIAYLCKNNVWLNKFLCKLPSDLHATLYTASKIVFNKQYFDLFFDCGTTRLPAEIKMASHRLIEHFNSFVNTGVVYNGIFNVALESGESKVRDSLKMTNYSYSHAEHSFNSDISIFFDLLREFDGLSSNGLVRRLAMWHKLEHNMHIQMYTSGCKLVDVLNYIKKLPNWLSLIKLGSRLLLNSNYYHFAATMLCTMPIIAHLAEYTRYFQYLPKVINYNSLLLSSPIMPRKMRNTWQFRFNRRANSIFLKLLIKSTKSNCFVNLLINGFTLVIASCGKIGFKKTHRSTYFAAQQLGLFIGMLVKSIWFRLFFRVKRTRGFRNKFSCNKKRKVFKALIPKSSSNLFINGRHGKLNTLSMYLNTSDYKSLDGIYTNLFVDSYKCRTMHTSTPMSVYAAATGAFHSVVSGAYVQGPAGVGLSVKQRLYGSVLNSLMSMYYRSAYKYRMLMHTRRNIRAYNYRKNVFLTVNLSGIGMGSKAIPAPLSYLLNGLCIRTVPNAFKLRRLFGRLRLQTLRRRYYPRVRSRIMRRNGRILRNKVHPMIFPHLSAGHALSLLARYYRRQHLHHIFPKVYRHIYSHHKVNQLDKYLFLVKYWQLLGSNIKHKIYLKLLYRLGLVIRSVSLRLSKNTSRMRMFYTGYKLRGDGLYRQMLHRRWNVISPHNRRKYCSAYINPKFRYRLRKKYSFKIARKITGRLDKSANWQKKREIAPTCSTVKMWWLRKYIAKYSIRAVKSILANAKLAGSIASVERYIKLCQYMTKNIQYYYGTRTIPFSKLGQIFISLDNLRQYLTFGRCFSKRMFARNRLLFTINPIRRAAFSLRRFLFGRYARRRFLFKRNRSSSSNNRLSKQALVKNRNFFFGRRKNSLYIRGSRASKSPLRTTSSDAVYFSREHMYTMYRCVLHKLYFQLALCLHIENHASNAAAHSSKFLLTKINLFFLCVTKRRIQKFNFIVRDTIVNSCSMVGSINKLATYDNIHFLIDIYYNLNIVINLVTFFLNLYSVYSIDAICRIPVFPWAIYKYFAFYLKSIFRIVYVNTPLRKFMYNLRSLAFVLGDIAQINLFRVRTLFSYLLSNFMFMKSSLVTFLVHLCVCYKDLFVLRNECLGIGMNNLDLVVVKRRAFNFVIFNRKFFTIPHNGCRARKLRRK